MKRAQAQLTRAVRLCTVCFALSCSAFSSAQTAPVAVLLHDSDGVVPDVSINLTRAMFTLRARSLPDGDAVNLFVFDDSHPVHEEFCRSVLGIFPYVLRRTWDQALFSGIGLVPATVDSEEEMLIRLRSTPGGMGYLPYTQELKKAIADSPIVIVNEPMENP